MEVAMTVQETAPASDAAPTRAWRQRLLDLLRYLWRVLDALSA
jgi:hypothetical protein